MGAGLAIRVAGHRPRQRHADDGAVRAAPLRRGKQVPVGVPGTAKRRTAAAGGVVVTRLRLCGPSETQRHRHDLLHRQATGVPHASGIAEVPAWASTPLRDVVLPRVLELSHTSYRIAPYARDMGDNGPPFRWNPERRTAIRAELDAVVMHVYGLGRDEVAHVLDSFPVVRKYEERDYGEFRTKRLVLDGYDAMAAAAAARVAWRSPLDPPPGSGCRHENRGGS